MNRLGKRLEFAKSIQSVTRSDLIRYGITRVSDVTNLDIIGIPVFTSCRPLSKIISISCGKSLHKENAKAGAIMEGIEVHCAEHPVNDFTKATYSQIKGNAIHWRKCPLSRDCLLNDSMEINWDFMHSIQGGKYKLVPAPMIWMGWRNEKELFHNFQASSNGLASGVDEEDASISALYEVVERDAWTLHDYALTQHRSIPQRIEIPDKELQGTIESKGLNIYLFNITTKIGIPAFKASLMDIQDLNSGLFSGFGCNRDYRVAAERAILEAVQSRCCYIAGARDDLMRRQFLIMKGADQAHIKKFYDSIPCDEIEFPYSDRESELDYCVRKLSENGFKEIYFRNLHKGAIAGNRFSVVRIFVPGLEGPQFDNWSPSERAKKWASRY